jgi:hypothetical protein
VSKHKHCKHYYKLLCIIKKKDEEIAAGVPLSGNVSIDSPTFAVDSVNNRVGIGTSTPGFTLDVSSGNVVGASFSSTGTQASPRINAVTVTANSAAGIWNYIGGAAKWFAGVSGTGGGTNYDYILFNNQGGGAVVRVDGDTNKLNADLAPDTVTSEDIAPDAVTASELAGVTKLIMTTCVIDFPTIPADTSDSTNCTVTGAASTDEVVVMPKSQCTGLVLVGAFAAPDAVTVSARNVAAGATDCGSTIYSVIVWDG